MTVLGEKFGFTIVDDTDLATLETVKPVYDLLASLGMRTTKTAWALPCSDRNNPYCGSATLADPGYASWIRDLRCGGFEIAFHGASAGSSTREETLRGLEVFERVVGALPTLHLNHHRNRENLYWGVSRFNSVIVREAVRLASKNKDVVYEGHVPGSPYFWGDICQQTIRYSRNFTFVDEIDVTRLNPTIPYVDPKRPFVNRWFSSCDGGDPDRFVHLLRRENLEKLRRARGVCIIYAHFGKNFVRDGKVRPDVIEALKNVAGLEGGIFEPATALLDRLWDASGKAGKEEERVLPRSERRHMELVWLGEKLRTGTG